MIFIGNRLLNEISDAELEELNEWLAGKTDQQLVPSVLRRKPEVLNRALGKEPYEIVAPLIARINAQNQQRAVRGVPDAERPVTSMTIPRKVPE